MARKSSGTNHYCPACKSAVDRVDTVCLNCESSRPPTGWPVDPYIGRILSKKYRIDRRLSVGGFGIVFLATQVHQGQDIGDVIIKMLHSEHAFDPVVTRRFINEVKAARSINSAHVVKIFDMDFDQGNIPYMVQEFVEGEGLADLLEKQATIEPARAVSIAIQVAEGMDEAHSKDIIHRDLKPENILLQSLKRHDYVKIIDFGIARVVTADGLATTSFVGTPRYMPPEQIKGKELDGRADIYALGVILFEMIAGCPPIEAKDSDMEYLTLNLTQEPSSLRAHVPDIPEQLDDLIQMMIAKDPTERPPSMGHVQRELEHIAMIAGYTQEITGEFSVPSDISDTSLDEAARGLVSTPTSAHTGEARPEKGKASDEFTDERPASGQHGATRARTVSSLTAVLAGVGAFLAVVAVAAIVVLLVSSGDRRGPTPEPGTSSHPGIGPEKKAPGTATDAASDARPDPAPEPVEKVEDLAPVPGKPPAVEVKPKKRPSKKPPRPKPKTDPWTKI